MKRLVPWLSAVALLGGGATPFAADTVIRNAQVLTMLDGPQYRGMDLVVRDGVFVDEAAPANATVVDATGRFVIPGLAEMHAHVPVVRFDQNAERYREDVLFLWVANGVTLARGMMGHPSHLELRGALEANEVLGPRLITSGPSFSGRDRTAAAASDRVREQKEAGYDLLKIHPGLPPDVFHAVASTANEVGIEFSGHVTGSIGLIAKALSATSPENATRFPPVTDICSTVGPARSSNFTFQPL